MWLVWYWVSQFQFRNAPMWLPAAVLHISLKLICLYDSVYSTTSQCFSINHRFCSPSMFLLWCERYVRALVTAVSSSFPLADEWLSLSAVVVSLFIIMDCDTLLSVCVIHCSSYLPICLFPGVSGEDVEDLHVFLLVCGLRRVKDPLYLLEAFSGTGITP